MNDLRANVSRAGKNAARFPYREEEKRCQIAGMETRIHITSWRPLSGSAPEGSPMALPSGPCGIGRRPRARPGDARLCERPGRSLRREASSAGGGLNPYGASAVPSRVQGALRAVPDRPLSGGMGEITHGRTPCGRARDEAGIRRSRHGTRSAAAFHERRKFRAFSIGGVFDAYPDHGRPSCQRSGQTGALPGGLYRACRSFLPAGPKEHRHSETLRQRYCFPPSGAQARRGGSHGGGICGGRGAAPDGDGRCFRSFEESAAGHRETHLERAALQRRQGRSNRRRSPSGQSQWPARTEAAAAGGLREQGRAANGRCGKRKAHHRGGAPVSSRGLHLGQPGCLNGMARVGRCAAANIDGSDAGRRNNAMTEKRITVDLTVERVTYTQIARDPDMHGGLGMLLTVAVRGDGPGDPPVIIGFSREAARTIYEAFLENPPPPNRTLPHRH